MQGHSFWLPPEVWRECHRWATLPSTGRLPTDLPATCLDIWPKGVYWIDNVLDGPDVCYPSEQFHLYPTKRNLMLVCREWYHTAIVWMYESLVFDRRRGVGKFDKLRATLETPRGAELTKLVKRIDINMYKWTDGRRTISDESFSHIRFLDQHCPNAKIFVPWHGETPAGKPVSTTCMWDADALFASHMENDPEFSTAAATWRFLRIIEDSSRNRPPAVTLSQGFKRLERLTLDFWHTSCDNTSPLLASLRCHPLVSLTHLTIKLFFGNCNQPSIRDFLRQFGKQLRFFALVVNDRDPHFEAEPFTDLLFLIPNVKELVLPLGGYVRASVPMPEQYRSVEIFGASRSRWTSRSYSLLIGFLKMATWSFPSLKVVRVLGMRSFESPCLRIHGPCADKLLMREIRVEDREGKDIRPFLCKSLG